MDGGDPIVPRDSAVYREFARLYAVARRLQPTPVDRWSGVLRAAHTPPGGLPRWGALDPKTGDLKLSADLVLPYLTGPDSGAPRRAQGQALASVLHEATHAGMQIDAPDEPNAVRTDASWGLMEAFAEYRAVHDFENFATAAGYPDLYLAEPQYPGWFAAMDNLVEQVSGPAKDRQAFVAEAIRGPGAMHFDQLADSAVKNRLRNVVPAREDDQRAIRAALIATMTHRLWPTLRDRPTKSGLMVANEIRQHLDAKVDEIRSYYRADPRQPFPAEAPNPSAIQLADSARSVASSNEHHSSPDAASRPGGSASDPAQSNSVEMRFLSGQAPATGAVARAPSLGQGQRGAGRPSDTRRSRPDRDRER